MGTEDWLISLNEARRRSTVIVEDIVDDACSTRRVNSAWEMISMPVIKTDSHILST